MSSSSDSGKGGARTGFRTKSMGDVVLDVVGRQLGKYRVIAELGHGGMADVYLAVASGMSGFNKIVVLKIIRPESAEEPEAVAMFLDEARVAGRLNHPNVVHTIEVGEEAGLHLLVMEYLDGQSLWSVLRRSWKQDKGVDLKLALRVVCEALQGLHYAHGLKDFDGTPLHVVHRDVTPQNIFVTYDGQIKVLDFGIAKAAISSNETRAGMMKGKAAFIAPEQIAGDPIDARADVYGMGVVLWQIAARSNWWKGMSQGQVLMTSLNGAIPAPSTVNPDVDPEFERICLKAMCHVRQERYASALDLHADLEALAERLGPPVSNRDVGNYVAELFAAERADNDAIIEDKLRGLAELDNVSLSQSGRVRTVGAGMSTTGGESTPRGLTHSAPAHGGAGGAGVSVFGGASGKIVSGLAVLALVGLVIWVATRSGSVTDESPVATAPVESIPIGFIASATGSVSSPPAPAVDAPTTVVLFISSIPEGAKLFFDDEPLGDNPSRREVLHDGKVHQVRAESPGFASTSVEVKADGAKEVVLTLRRLGGRSAPAAAATKAPPPAKTEAPAPPPATTKPEEPKNARDRIKELDTSNPWGK